MKDILITAAQVEEWKNREKELEEELALIRQRLNAIPLFTDMPSLANPLNDLSPADAIMDIIEGTKTPMPSATILAELKKRSYPESKLGKQNAYFYSVMNRLVKRNILTKKDGDYRLAQAQSDLKGPTPTDKPAQDIYPIRTP